MAKEKNKGAQRIYKIRRKDGLFSEGGTWPCFEKRGKIWLRKGDVTSHISQVYNKSLYKNCVIVEYELTEVSSVPFVVEYFDKLLNMPQSTMYGGLSS